MYFVARCWLENEVSLRYWYPLSLQFLLCLAAKGDQRSQGRKTACDFIENRDFFKVLGQRRFKFSSSGHWEHQILSLSLSPNLSYLSLSLYHLSSIHRTLCFCVYILLKMYHKKPKWKDRLPSADQHQCQWGVWMQAELCCSAQIHKFRSGYGVWTSSRLHVDSRIDNHW